ncbi:sensor histidine kinase [Emticicia sp. SJ17W-69]|uniref:sensor histidine kinase n=1 Tax=Emticicia sp. SJ17W-69 TaxID=3421657 RepID=UPI003EBB88F0
MIRNLLILLLLVIASIFGFSWYHYHSVKNINSLTLEIEHFEDLQNINDPNKLIQSDLFKKLPQSQSNFGNIKTIQWFRFKLEAGLVPRELSLEITNHTINELELFELKNDTLISLGKTGDWYKFSQRPSPTKNFVYPINLDSYQKATYLLKVDKKDENLITEILLWNTNDFENSDQRTYFLWGFFVGIVLLIVMLSMIFGWLTKDPVYIWFTLYILGLSLRQLTDSGLGFQYIWYDFPIFNRPNPLLQALWLFLPTMLQFQQYFFELKKYHKKLYYLAEFFKYFFISLFCVFLILQLSGYVLNHNLYVLSAKIHSISSSLGTCVFLLIAIVHLRSKDILKRFFAIAILVQLLGFILVIVKNLLQQYQEKNLIMPESHIIYLWIFLIDMILFTYILSVRYRSSYNKNQQLQIGLIQVQQEVNQGVIDSLESEREQINLMLQSGVGDKLIEAQNQIKNLENTPLLSDSLKLIDKANQDLSKISKNLLPIEFAEKGLVQTVQELILKLNQTQKITFNYTVKGNETRLSTQKEVQIYRIISELINNILKHSAASIAQISFNYENQKLIVLTEDNGKGFEISKLDASTSGIGVKNLYSRVSYLKGEIKIDSGNEGTKITIEIPT